MNLLYVCWMLSGVVSLFVGIVVVILLFGANQKLEARKRSAQALAAKLRAKGLVEIPALLDDYVVGDVRDDATLAQAMRDVRAVYHICPAVQQDEAEIGHRLISAAQAAGVGHFVFHSVLHPQIAALPHHAQKLRVETALIQSGVPFTILQPASYMQNLLGVWDRIVQQG